MNGFFGHILVIDLANRQTRVEPLESIPFERHLVGKGLGTDLLLERNPARIDTFIGEKKLLLGSCPRGDVTEHRN